MPDNFPDFIGRLNEEARTSLYYADSIARGYGSTLIGTEYLLLGSLAQGDSLGAKILIESGVTLDKAEQALNLKPGLRRIKIGVNTLTEPAQVSLKMAWQLAEEYGSSYLGTEHILHGLLVQEKSKASELLGRLGVHTGSIVTLIEDHINNQNRTQNIETDQIPREKFKNILKQFGVDLTQKARQGELDSVIGRSKEITRIITILSRRRKNNPLLIGEPGVGKTAIVEGLALKIAEGSVPVHLRNMSIIQIDLASVISGTKYRGEFEERVRRIIAAVKKSSDVILFIDEIHLLVGAGAAEGSMDGANLLKPALARGEIRLIGATTLDEYKKHIEKDSALTRRFQSIIAKEPSKSEVMAILRGLRENYQKHHNVLISDDILENAVYLADRYIKDRFMPDKAIDVLDEASALVRVRVGNSNISIANMADEIDNLESKINNASQNEEYKEAADLKTKLLQLKKQYNKANKKRKTFPVTIDDIAKATSNITGIPSEKLQKSEQRMLVNLEKHLSKYLIGQNDAVVKVANSIRLSRSGIANSSRPMGSFIFMGPTGVGKTELARVLAREIFGSNDNLVKIDMSEFSEKHTASRLIGAPAGYIGYDDGGQLTDKIRRQPYSVVLFDEIEKAHPSIFHLLLQLLEDGTITDGQGRSVDFTNTIVILTSNLGAEAMQKESELGFMIANAKDRRQFDDVHKHNAEAARAALDEFMPPELINRFDSIITFRALERKQVNQIIDLFINDLKDRLSRKGISLVLSPSAKKILINKGYSKKYGVRPLRRTIEDIIEHPIAEGIIKGDFVAGTIITVYSKRGNICMKGGYESDEKS